MKSKKLISILALSLIIAFPSFAQKRGYKELQIGKSLQDPVFDAYKILIDNKEKNHFQIQECKDLKICDLQVELIDIYTDSNSLIKEIYLFTKNKNFKDAFELLDDTKSTFFCLKNSIEGPDKIVNNAKDYEAFWIFEDEKVGLSVGTKQHSVVERDFNEHWVFRWAEI